MEIKIVCSDLPAKYKKPYCKSGIWHCFVLCLCFLSLRSLDGKLSKFEKQLRFFVVGTSFLNERAQSQSSQKNWNVKSRRFFIRNAAMSVWFFFLSKYIRTVKNLKYSRMTLNGLLGTKGNFIHPGLKTFSTWEALRPFMHLWESPPHPTPACFRERGSFWGTDTGSSTALERWCKAARKEKEGIVCRCLGELRRVSPPSTVARWTADDFCSPKCSIKCGSKSRKF